MSGGSDPAGADNTIRLAAVPDFQLGGLRVRPSLRQVGNGVREISIEPRVMQALVALAEAGGAVVSRDRLIERCWGGRIVGEDAINSCIAKVRPLADMVQPAAFVIETVARVGYRLAIADVPAPVAPVPPAAPRPASISPAAGGAPRELRRVAAPTGPAAIALAAFALVVGAAAVAWLMLAPPAAPADRMTLRIDPFTGAGPPGVADLAAEYTQAAIERLSQSAVLVVETAAAATGSPVSPARYVLSGAVQADGAAVKIAVQLVERPTGRLLYTSQTRQPAQAGPAAAYGTMTRLLAGIEGNVRLAEFARYAGPPRDAQDLVLRASAAAIPWAPGHDAAALALGERALAQDPDSPAAQTVMAELLFNDALGSPAASGDAEARRALALVDQALDRWPRNLIDRHLRALLLVVAGDLPAARAAAESALVEEPDNPGMVEALSQILLLQGDIAGSMRVLPPDTGDDPLQVVQQFALGRYTEALAAARRSDAVSPPDSFALLLEAAILARLGQLPAARAAVNSALPGMPPGLGHVQALRQVLFSLPDASWRLFQESLREAALPA